jgi:hypothetical protein
MVNVAGWRWQWWLPLPARWGSAILPPPRPRLPQSAFAPTLDGTHGRSRSGAASLATKIAWPNAMLFICFWGFVKDSVFLPPLPQALPELRRRIIAAISEIDRDMLQRVWAEVNYRLDVCRVTKGVHIEHLRRMQSFSFHLYVACCNPFRHWSVPILWNVSGNYE